MPIIVGTARIDDCGCCEGSPPYLVVGDCQSLTGTASICGFSGYSADAAPYDPLNPGDWEGQYRKWQQRALSGTITTTSGKCTSCYGGVNADEFYQTATMSGTATLTCSGSTDGLFELEQYGVGGGCGSGTPFTFSEARSELDQGPFTTLVSPGCGSPLPGQPVDFAFVEQVQTLTTRVLTGCGCRVDLNGIEREASGSQNATLSDEHYFYDALAERLANEGESSGITSGQTCCASLETAPLTTPESRTSMSLTGTAVRVQFTIFNCSPMGAEYTVNVTLRQGTEDFVLSIPVKCLIPFFFHVPLPAPGEDPICFVSAALVL